MADNQTSNDDTKYIGVKISNDFYWLVKEKLLEKRLSMSEAIVQALITFLNIDTEKLLEAQKTSTKITDMNNI